MIQVFEHIDSLQKHLNKEKGSGKTIGFVPTMGALHEGHLSLIQASQKDNDLTVCSIFVNPTQFNDPNDLRNYPRNFESDLELLKSKSCDVIFLPSVDEVYPESLPKQTFDFGPLESVMEGAHRPGHFNGVATVVKRLFDIVQPHHAYFGLKDFQQLAIIHKMTKDLELPIEIVPCKIIREEHGLAMSSRNELLGKKERKQAGIIYNTLKHVKNKAGFESIAEIKEHVNKVFGKQNNCKLEYFEIVDLYTLKPMNSWAESMHVIACIAVYFGNVRLIDNIILFS